ncbi:MAG: hypothetical protein H7337_21025 [Rhizobacter sp.]|nr:hypothetical protein [Rhizobacter sp.]
MHSKLALAVLALGAACTAPCVAQVAPEAAPSTTERGEPNVKRTVTEDGGARIDELRVRGQTERVTVTPKLGFRKPYEIITGNAGRDTFDGTGGARSAVGKRVWNVLDF